MEWKYLKVNEWGSLHFSWWTHCSPVIASQVQEFSRITSRMMGWSDHPSLRARRYFWNVKYHRKDWLNTIVKLRDGDDQKVVKTCQGPDLRERLRATWHLPWNAEWIWLEFRHGFHHVPYVQPFCKQEPESQQCAYCGLSLVQSKYCQRVETWR
jgi:hypothetical protein